MAEIETGSYAPAARRITVATLLDALLLDYETNGKSISLARYIDGHLRPYCGHLLASRLETGHLQRYVLKRRKAGISNKTIKNELGLLRRAFNLAREQAPPLIALVPVFPKIKAGPPRKGFFEHPEFIALRSELPEHLRPVITFAYSTGCRKSEILNLLWGTSGPAESSCSAQSRRNEERGRANDPARGRTVRSACIPETD